MIFRFHVAKKGLCGFDCVEKAVQIGLNHLIPVFDRHILHCAIDVDARVVDQRNRLFV